MTTYLRGEVPTGATEMPDEPGLPRRNGLGAPGSVGDIHDLSGFYAMAGRRGLSAGSGLLAALGEVIHRWCDDDSFTLGVNRAGAESPVVFPRPGRRFADRAADVASARPARGWRGPDDELDVNVTSDVRVLVRGSCAAVAITWEWTTPRPPNLVESMAAAFGRLIGRLGSDERAWDDEKVELIPADQLARRAAANATARPVPPVSLCDLLESQVATRPNATAIVAPDRRITFAQLRAAAAVLAERVSNEADIGRPLIAIVMEKGWEQAVAVHAVLRLGRAYLPIDPSQPRSRIEKILRGAGVSTLITQPNLAGLLTGICTHQVLCDEAVLAGASPGATARRALVDPEQVAYVIPTSGSTGEPKGVTIRHRAVVNHVLDATERLGLGPSDRHLATAQLHFDLSVYDLFGPLVSGAAVILPDGGGVDPEGWLDTVDRAGVTFWAAVPPLMELTCELHEGFRRSPLTSLRRIALAGDWIPVNLPARLRGMAPRVEVMSFGGPAETTNWSVCYEIGEVDPLQPSIPYGKPMANAAYHIVGPGWTHRPDWVPGEMLVESSVCLADGYWNDPDRTAEAFVTEPRTGRRMYRTGDLGCYLPTGDIEILGRIDLQVKVRGHRVELGEIEHHLQSFPGVQRSVVVKATKEGAFPRLVAIVEGEGLNGAEIREFVRTKVPDYMVPSIVRCIPALPLSSNGKVDRARLAAEASSAAWKGE